MENSSNGINLSKLWKVKVHVIYCQVKYLTNVKDDVVPALITKPPLPEEFHKIRI
jgi:hypothetical protein